MAEVFDRVEAAIYLAIVTCIFVNFLSVPDTPVVFTSPEDIATYINNLNISYYLIKSKLRLYCLLFQKHMNTIYGWEYSTSKINNINTLIGISIKHDYWTFHRGFDINTPLAEKIVYIKEKIINHDFMTRLVAKQTRQESNL